VRAAYGHGQQWRKKLVGVAVVAHRMSGASGRSETPAFPYKKIKVCAPMLIVTSYFTIFI
jgi:hypothetical protein